MSRKYRIKKDGDLPIGRLSVKSTLNIRTALLLAISVSFLLNSLLLIMLFYGREAVIPQDGERMKRIFEFGNLGIHIFFNFIMAFILYLVNFKMIRNGGHLNPTWRWVYLAMLTLITTCILSVALSVVQIGADPHEIGVNAEKFIRGSLVRDFFISVVVMLSSQLLYLSEKQQRTALEIKSLMAENMRTRFSALKNQMDPHFLFNSLNTLNSLIKIDADKAQEYVQQLSFVFRYTLQNKEVITLEEELRFTRAYCALMRIRYGDSLGFEEKIDGKYDNWLIVPLSIQTLVENAIKHNVVSNKQPLTITIATGHESISISNPIQLKKEAESGEGIGLTNLAERYRLMWKKEITVNQTSDRFEITIPLIIYESPDNRG